MFLILVESLTDDPVSHSLPFLYACSRVNFRHAVIPLKSISGLGASSTIVIRVVTPGDSVSYRQGMPYRSNPPPAYRICVQEVR